MKILLIPTLQNDKITVSQDSSSEENNESEENFIPQQNYIQENHFISPEPIQKSHEVLEDQVTPIIEHGMPSRVSFGEEEMEDR